MAELSTLARPYAKAVFELAREGGDLAAWSDSLSALSSALSHEDVAGLIGHPALTRTQLGEALVEALTCADDQVKNLVRLLASNGRLKLVPAIAAEFEQLRAAAENRVDVQITTATDADDALKAALAEAVAKRLAREVNVSWNVDESLVAGAVIRAGDLVIDGSVAGDLDRLRQAVAG